MSMARFISSVCAAAVAFTISAQSYITPVRSDLTPPTPQSSRPVEYQMPQPSLLTGAVDLSIPIYNITSGDLSLPITLQYHTNGIKVLDDPCPFGYGWSLMPALRATRTILGRPDEHYPMGTDKYHDLTVFGYQCMVNPFAQSLIYPERYDAEHDIIRLALPGHTVVRVIDFSNGKAEFSGGFDQEYKVEADDNLDEITVTDAAGTKYVFSSPYEYEASSIALPGTLRTAWALTEIESLSGDKIMLKWSLDSHPMANVQVLGSEYFLDSFNIYEWWNSGISLDSFESSGYQEAIFENTGSCCEFIRLNKIEFLGGEVQLGYTYFNRSGNMLTEIKIASDNGSTVKTAKIGYDAYGRLPQSVELSDEGSYLMEYAEGSTVTPDRNAQDWWGFYNAKHNSGLVPKIQIKRYRIQQQKDGPYYEFGIADRSVDAAAMENNILKKVTYPTGGYSRFEYEPHQFTPRREEEGADEIHPETNPYLSEGGGLRVKLIETCPAKGSEVSQTVRYEYSPAVVREVPSMATFIDVNQSVMPLTQVPYSSGTIDYVRAVNIRPFSDCMRYDFGETPIWYETVKAVYDEGHIIYKHKDLIPYPNEIYKEYGKRGHASIYKLFSQGPQLVAREVYASENGSARLVERDSMHYEIESGYTIPSTYVYRALILIGTSSMSAPDFEDAFYVSGLAYGYTAEIDRDPYELYMYAIVPQTERLVRSEHTVYTETGPYTTGQTFEYERLKSMPKKASTYTSAGLLRTTSVQYVDAKRGGVEAEMARSGACGLPVAETTQSAGATVRTEARYARSAGGAWRMAAMPRIFGTDTLAPTQHSYNARGRLIGSTDPDGRSTAWEWAPEGLYPTAKLEGATPADTSAAIATRYKYKPLVGLQHSTAPWGTLTTYMYDGRNFLSAIMRNRTTITHEFAKSISHEGVNSMTTTEYLDNTRKHRVKEYFDGLGRTSGSHDLTTGVETRTEYDAMGRAWRTSEPGTGEPDPYAWTLRSYEPSPRGLIESTTKAGELWHTQGKSVRRRQLANTSSGEYACPLYDITTDGGVDTRDDYREGELMVEETEDEDGHITRKYTDKDGLTVMTEEGRKGDMLRTRRVYDSYGRLRYVLPPNLDDGLYGASDGELMEKAFIYGYDAVGRLISSKTPGCAPKLTRYSRGGRVVAEHSPGMADGQWLVAFYDRYGRSVLSALVSATEEEIAAYGEALPVATFSGSSDAEALCGYGFDRPLPFGTPNPQEAVYYDSYDFISALPVSYARAHLRPGKTGTLTAPRGLETGRLDCIAQDAAAVYYDNAGFVVERRQLMTGNKNSTLYERDRAGNVLRETEIHSRFNGTEYRRATEYDYDAAGRLTATRVEEDGATASMAYGYDSRGQRAWEECGNGVRREFDYDEHGWPAETRTTVIIPNKKRPLDTSISQHYYENIGAQLKGDSTKTSAAAITLRQTFTDRMLYADGAQPLFSGCPSGREISLKGRYDYSYDSHTRLTAAKYTPEPRLLATTEADDEDDEDFSTEYSYDAVGNVLTARRMGVVDVADGGKERFGVLDDLTYSYDGNRVTEIDNEPDGTDFYGRTGYPAATGSYSWDAAGRMTADSSRGLQKIDYDHRNLPTLIRHSNGTLESHTYTASGLLRAVTTVRRNGQVTRRVYEDDRVFDGDPAPLPLQYSYFAGGYFDGSGGVHYLHNDHQGSVVMVTDSAGMVEQRTSYYPYGEPHRNPAGQPILYGGKERLASTGEYAYGARRHHAAAIMWPTPDAKAHDYTYVSPYAFCIGNPIVNIDADGKRPIPYHAALMCLVSYKEDIANPQSNYNKSLEILAKSQWVISQFNTSIQKNHRARTNMGMQSMLFERTIDGNTEYAYVYAGTNSWEDGVEDITQLLGLSPQVGKAIENAKTLSEEVGDRELTFLGHSLGGELATVSSSVTGRDAITFNPAVASPATNARYNLSAPANVTNYISAITNILGMNITSDPVTIIQNLIGLKAPGETVSVSTGYLSHSIEDIIRQLFEDLK